MKALLQQNMAQARQIMVNNPQLTKALFQVQYLSAWYPMRLAIWAFERFKTGGSVNLLRSQLHSKTSQASV
jgi:hypothetical protein